MSRRRVVKKRPVPPDPVHNSRLVSMTVRRLMKDGKKSLAYGLIYKAFAIIKERTDNDPLEVFEEAIRNITPSVFKVR